eukprot:c12240_g1_i1 orf=268-1374(+)
MRWLKCKLVILVFLLTLCNNYSNIAHGLITNHAPAMFIFGDSLADVGNNNYIPFTSLKANFYPNGIDFAGKAASGRFCNGRLVLDILASRLGYPAPLPYLSPSTKGLALLQGVNYASAGCGILNETSNNSNGCLSLSTQLRYHTNMVKRILEELGAEETQDFLMKSLYFVLIGSNDFLGNYIRNNTGDAKLYSSTQFIGLLVSSLANDFMMLYNQSARHIVLVGLGPLGCIPAQRARAAKGACNEMLNYWARSLNEASQTLVKQLNSQYSDAMITFANPYYILEDFMQNPSTYGFNVTDYACCGGGKMNAQVPCLPLFTCCSNRSSHLFWDPWHPTEAANTLMADAFLSASSTLVAPWSIQQVANGAT